MFNVHAKSVRSKICLYVSHAGYIRIMQWLSWKLLYENVSLRTRLD